MHRFWDKVIRPILIAAQPRTIVEIGSLSGLNTFKLLDYCKLCDAECTVIDPGPQYNIELLEAYYERHVRVLRQFSLDALPTLRQYDLILIDGDHNWYTVYYELKEVERMAESTGRFPTVLFHDTGWPYGRRDMYYFPESIPESYRQPYERKGMEPGKSELLETGGFNSIALNAVHEHGERNGVLTAIEDFAKQCSFELDYFELKSNNGLGVLIPRDSELHRTLPYILASSGL
ncbi:class I SAM-dependent methyltransferase [Cohnella sp. GCM10027633]|uniref:class I SAM-dependent methyltransferase n=1 Tax=unclassified Cohnella TaxID=2636738 RepID=UPI00363B48A4